MKPAELKLRKSYAFHAYIMQLYERGLSASCVAKIVSKRYGFNVGRSYVSQIMRANEKKLRISNPSVYDAELDENNLEEL